MKEDLINIMQDLISETAGAGDSRPASKNPPEKKDLGRLDLEISHRRDDLERATAIYTKYQENKKKAQLLEAELLKGVNTGQNIYNLFLKAVEIISALTGSDVLQAQIKNVIPAVYGVGLQEAPAVEAEIAAIKKRIAMLKNNMDAVEDASIKLRIANSIKNNQRLLTQLQSIQ